MTDRIAEQRDRPFYVAVRIATTLEACRRIGYDIETWVKEGLCDMVVAGGNSGSDPGVEVESFKDMLAGTGIRLYPGYDSHGRQEARRLMPVREWREAWYRALSQEFWSRGADGIYVFNWHANERTRRAELTTIGKPETLKQTDKVYAAIHRQIAPQSSLRAGADANDRIYGETPVNLYSTLTGDGPQFHVPICDAVAEEAKAGALESVELHIELDHYSGADEVAVKLDGNLLGSPTVRSVSAEDPDNPSDVDESSWLVWRLDPEQTDDGVHTIRVRLVKRDSRLRQALTVNHVEIWVRYKREIVRS